MMTEEQQQLYDIVDDWWDAAFIESTYTSLDATLMDLVNAIIEWKEQKRPTTTL